MYRTKNAFKHPQKFFKFQQIFHFWWALQGSNLRPLRCERNALPLS